MNSKFYAAALALTFVGTMALMADVTSVSARQRWPWNGKVDIVYTLMSAEANPTFDITFSCKDGTNDVAMTTVTGDGANGTVTGTGTKVLTWDAGADYADNQSSGLTYGITALEHHLVSYMKVNLNNGEVTFLKMEDNKTDWTAADKSDYLWLRKIPAGTFTMGSSTNEAQRGSTEYQHEVTLSRDYYIGVFEMTRDQYNKIDTEGAYHGTFSSPSQDGGALAANKIGYTNLRGSVQGITWPDDTSHSVDTNSFLGLLRAKCGNEYAFDLPTEAQWEYACRGEFGTDGKWNDGSDIQNTDVDTNLDNLGWYSDNADSAIHEVGLKNPNSYGLYDMHGNVEEWCLDRYKSNVSDQTFDPVGGPTSSANCMLRGGRFTSKAKACRPSNRNNYYYDQAGTGTYGVRVALEMPVEYMKVDLNSGDVEIVKTYGNKTDWTEEDKSDYLWLRRIPAGTFVMGSSAVETQRRSSETQHQVTLTKDFYIGVFQLTRDQYNKIDTGAYYHGAFDLPSEDGARAAHHCSYDDLRGTLDGATWPTYIDHRVDMNSFLGLLRAKCGGEYAFDLPTEAQWEYACRGEWGTDGKWNDGSAVQNAGTDTNLNNVGWYNGNIFFRVQEVGLKTPNSYGLYDMHGNVWEWCLDWYQADITSMTTDPVGAATGKTRVQRGGCWGLPSTECRSATRCAMLPRLREFNFDQTYGARIALTIEPEPVTYMKVNLNNGEVETVQTYGNKTDWTAEDKSDYLWLRKIPAGTFTMGSSTNETQRAAESEAQHQVTLTKDFYMSVFQLTRDQYNKIDTDASYHAAFSNPTQTDGALAANKCSYEDLRGTSDGATWPTYTDYRVDTNSFLGLLRAKCGGEYAFDLPTEAQWEYACRGEWGTDGHWNDGSAIQNTDQDTNLDNLGWYAGNAEEAIHEVGLKTPNSYGLYDMHGNVFEWCLDWYQDDITSLTSDPVGPVTGSNRVIHGGCWGISARGCRPAYRHGSPSGRYYYSGARLALTIEPEAVTYMKVNLNNGEVETVRTYGNKTDWTDADKSDYLWLRKIPAGTFMMGSSVAETQRSTNEAQHPVNLTKDFYIGVFQLTRDQYNKIDTSASYHGTFDYPDQADGALAANHISYDNMRGTSDGATWPTYTDHRVDNASFLGLLRAKCGGEYAFDLPTEAQREYACRGSLGTDGKWNDGSAVLNSLTDSNLDNLGWNFDNAESVAHEVGLKTPNSYGLYDMHGNVLEWCLDWYQGNITSMTVNPVGAATGVYRVLRGGGWNLQAPNCRSASRDISTPPTRGYMFGARVALVLE